VCVCVRVCVCRKPKAVSSSLWNDSFMRVMWLCMCTCMCVCVCVCVYVSEAKGCCFVNMTWLIHTCDMTLCVCVHLCVCVCRCAWRRPTAVSSWTWRDLFIRVMRLYVCVCVCMCVCVCAWRSQSCLFFNVTWLIHTCDVTLFVCVNVSACSVRATTRIRHTHTHTHTHKCVPGPWAQSSCP